MLFARRYRFLLVLGTVTPLVALTPSVAVAAPTTPTITTTASGSVAIGGKISDSAVLAGGNAPTGSITFKVYGPNIATCSGAAASSSTVSVSGNGPYASAPFTVTKSGTYRYVASYAGDANNNPVTEGCNGSGESVTVTAVKPTFTTTASADVTLGKPISDTAVLSGGNAPTGSITFRAYGPDNATCTGTAAATSTKTVTGNGTYTSTSFTPKTAGVYRFIATYSGNANNGSVADSCGTASESVTVNKVQPTVTATPSPATTALGHTISETVVIAAGTAPTGTITAKIYGPNVTSCTGTPVATSTVTVTGNGTYHTQAFQPTTVGSYQFLTTYNGDKNNAATTTTCGASNQQVVITQVDSALSLTLSGLSTTYGSEQTETFSAALASSVPSASSTGTVSVIDRRSGQTVCTITLVNGGGSCSLGVTELNEGRYTVYGSFPGNTNTKASMSSSHQFVVNPGATHTTLGLTNKHLRFGHERATRLLVTVTAANVSTPPTGHVLVRSGGAKLCKITLSSGDGSCRFGKRRLSVGHHHLVAQYLGGQNLHPSHSAHRRIRVTAH
jgi:hypothetical protein